MALSADGRLSLSTAGQLRGNVALPRRDWRLVKFCNGELMGKKLNMMKRQCNSSNKNVKQNICMSLTTNNIAGESKLRDLELERRDPRTVVAVILGGGAGTRLFPLTKRRAKPADARSKDIEDVLILSGDHLYRMDYMDFVQNHRESGADITISSLPIDNRRASDFGLMKIDNKGRVLSFSEKPKGQELKAMAVDTTVLGLSKDEAEKKPYIASMGVYVFKKEILLNLLRWRFPTANDFGSEIIPASANEFFIKAYLFNDYWEDIGTIRSFFEANLALTEHPPRFSFYDATKPIYTSRRNLPPSSIDNSKLVDSIISHGSFLTDCFIEHSVIGIRSRINANVHLKDTVMLGADFYETAEEKSAILAEGGVPIGIGENTKIKDCIIDKNARIGKNVVIANSERVEEADRSAEGFYIRSGITIITKNSTIKDGVVI
ncbi:Trimeric LpxA-like protein [Corchorus capsularis]|uniref:glucose-1-phosphate adenylyltransferase n=1 Tax=Corchorus capsularis TaxID=210143 RepID=A0A1R3GT84_COCAP|nr:Trimeric LpxA-like protein [Corchorus capsularis]